jgi:hypothetical protein
MEHLSTGLFYTLLGAGVFVVFSLIGIVWSMLFAAKKPEPKPEKETCC